LQSDNLAATLHLMTRPARLEFPHIVYYVTSRGNARQFAVRDNP